MSAGKLRPVIATDIPTGITTRYRSVAAAIKGTGCAWETIARSAYHDGREVGRYSFQWAPVKDEPDAVPETENLIIRKDHIVMLYQWADGCIIETEDHKWTFSPGYSLTDDGVSITVQGTST